MRITEAKSLELSFPPDSGFSSSHILFYSGRPDLSSLFPPADSTRNRLFVTDSTIASLEPCREFFFRFTGGRQASQLPAVYRDAADTLCVLGAGESFKTMENVLAIARAALDSNFNRNCLFVSIGGGVLCDMTGFAASIFKRGVDVEFVPTTLLADVDAAIGGKTGCDFGSYKNMIGSFYPARNIHIWSGFVQSLPQKEFISGLGEVIKTALLFSRELTDILKASPDAVLGRNQELLEKMIFICAQAKAKTVHEDFREHGKRSFLNYGHTFAHALESAAGLGTVTHGEAVAWGIARALDLSRMTGRCSGQFAAECKELLSSYGYDIRPVPGALQGMPGAQQKLLEAMHKDKKNSSSRVKVILQSGAQETHITEVSDSELCGALQ